MFTDPQNHKKVVSPINLSILVFFSKMATIGHLGFWPVKKKLPDLEILPKVF